MKQKMDRQHSPQTHTHTHTHTDICKNTKGTCCSINQPTAPVSLVQLGPPLLFQHLIIYYFASTKSTSTWKIFEQKISIAM